MLPHHYYLILCFRSWQKIELCRYLDTKGHIFQFQAQSKMIFLFKLFFVKWQCSQVIWAEKDLRDHQVYLQEAEPQRGKDDSFMIPKWEFRFRSHQSTAFLLFTFPLVLHTTLLITYFSLDCVFFSFLSTVLSLPVMSDSLRHPWTAAHQAPQSMGILQASMLEWVAIPSSRDLPNPGIEPRSPALQVDSLVTEPSGKPKNMEWVACPISRGSSWPRNQTGISCIAGGFFTSWATRVQIFFTFVLFCILSIFQNWKYIQNLIESHK